MNLQHDNEIQEYIFPSTDLTENSDDGSMRTTDFYGSPWELKNDARRYRNFSGTHGKQQEFSEMFTNTYVSYKTFRGNVVLFKQDVFATLHRFHFTLFDEQKDELAPMALAILLKFHEDKLANCCEFVAYNEELFNHIKNKITIFLVYGIEECQQLPSIGTFEKALTFLKEILPVEWDDEVHGPMKLKLKQEFSSDRHELAKILNYIKCLMETYTRIFQKHPTLFLPASDLKHSQQLRAIRLFHDGNRCFLMKDEVDKVLGRPSQYDSTKIKTIEYKDVLEDLKEHKDVEVVKTPIVRTRLRAQPIRDSNWKLCKLASDCVFEFLYDVIHGFELFQRSDVADWKTILMCFDKLEQCFSFGEKTIQFMSLEDFPAAKDIFSFAKDRKVREIRDVGSDGFTVEDLMDELKHLQLQPIFNDIFDHVHDVYKWILRERKGMKLRNCDMKDAVVQCQLICWMKRSSNIAKFLHDHNVCHRIAYTSCCSEPPSFQSPQNSRCQRVQLSAVADGETSLIDVPVDCGKCYNLFEWNNLSENDPELRLFLLSAGDLELVQHSRMSAADKRSCLKNFNNFTTAFAVEKVFVRFFDTTYMLREETSVVFADEVLDVIRYLLKKKGDKTQNQKLKSYVSMWKSDDPADVPKSIFLDQFEAVLSDFNIDKSLITLVSDFLNYKSVLCALPHEFTHNAVIFTPTFKSILSSSEAIFMIFTECIGFWLEPTLRERILSSMNNILMSTDKFHYLEDIKQIILDLKNRPYSLAVASFLSQLSEIFKARMCERFSIDKFLLVCQKTCLRFESPKSIGQQELATTFVQVWKARLLLSWKLCNQLFGEKHPELKEHVRSAIGVRAPIDEWMDEEEFQSVLVNMTQADLRNKKQKKKVQEPEYDDEKKSIAVLKEIVEHSKTIERIDLDDVIIAYPNEVPSTLIMNAVNELRAGNESEARDLGKWRTKLVTRLTAATRRLPNSTSSATATQCLRISTTTASSGSGQAATKTSEKTDHGSLSLVPAGSENPESPKAENPQEGSASSEPSSSSSTPPPVQSKRKVLGELFKLKQESLDSQESEETKKEPTTNQVSGANIKFVSKKNKKRIHQLDNKPKLLERMEVTDNSPPSNNCDNEKCKRVKETCDEKGIALANAEKEVAELQKNIRVLNREFNVEAVSKRENKLSEEIENLKKLLKESTEREKKLKKENETLTDHAEKQRKEHEKEVKRLLRDNEKKTEEAEQELKKARKSVKNAEEELSKANAKVSCLQELCDDYKIQLQMPAETRNLYSTLKQLEQEVRWQQPLAKVRKQAQKIVELSENDNEREGAMRTLVYYERSLDNYMEKLTSQIEVLKLNPEISTKTFDSTDPLPPFPEVSPMFTEAYQKTLSK